MNNLSTGDDMPTLLARTATPPNAPRRVFGLLARRERWGLTLRGWLVLCAGLGSFGLCLLHWVHPFLAVNSSVSGEALVIEGWIPTYAVHDAATQFKRDGFQSIFTVGGPVGEADYPAAPDNTYAYVAMRKLVRAGLFSADRVQMVPSNIRTRDRTFGSALALRHYFESNSQMPAKLTVVTLGPHARRSRLLFQQAFGPQTKVGVISITNREYNPRRWWQYSEGIKEVVSESAAYLYVRFLFQPEISEQ